MRQNRLVAYTKWFAWSPKGYSFLKTLPKNETLEVLTPKSIFRAIAAGYAPPISIQNQGSLVTYLKLFLFGAHAYLCKMEANLPLPKFYLNETEWHSEWKRAFPENFREVTFLNKELGYYHRADIHTPCNTTIEFQNSPITLPELQSRESFYPNLVWMINGKKFKGFKILKHLPDMEDPKIADYEFCHRSILSMVRKVDLLNAQTKPKPLGFHHPELRNIALSTYNFSFCWRHPHRVWYEAKCPLIFDFGGHFLYELKQRPQINGAYAYLKMFTRKSFIEQFLNAYPTGKSAKI